MSISVIQVSFFNDIVILEQTDTYTCNLAKVTRPMKARGLANWTSAIQGATAELCDLFTEGPTVLIRSNTAEEALAESIFTCAKRSPNYNWMPEESLVDGKFRNTYHSFYVLSLATVRLSEKMTLQTTLNSSKFKTILVKELTETSGRISLHLWWRAKHLIHNQTGFDGQDPHDNGIFLANIPVDEDLVKWWCDFSDEHGYGIFHQAQWDPVNLKYVMVGLHFIDTSTATDIYLQCSLNPQHTPFEHTTFANTFHVAAYGTAASGGFGLVRDHNACTPISEVSLYLGATICGWVGIRLIFVSQVSNLSTLSLSRPPQTTKTPTLWTGCPIPCGSKSKISLGKSMLISSKF